MTDFPNFVSVVHSSNCDTKHSLKISPHLKIIDTLPCESKFQVTVDNLKNISRKRQQPAEFVQNHNALTAYITKSLQMSEDRIILFITS